MKQRWWVLGVAMLLATTAQAITTDEIVKRSRNTLQGVDDFTTIMTFNVRSENVRVPDSRVRIYFKRPDKLKPEPIDGDFTVLPRTYNLAIGNILERMAADHTLQLLRSEKLGERSYHVLKLTPKDAGSPIQYHVVYVDQQAYTVGVIKSYPRNDKPATLTIGYRRHGRAWLPSVANVSGHIRRRDGDDVREEAVAVTLKFGDYKINTGLSDALFKDEE